MGLPNIPIGLENKANQVIDDLAAWCAANQPSYYQQHGYYWQGLQTPADLPVDGVESLFDKNRKPSDQAESWQDVAADIPLAGPITVEVNVYVGPLGAGYEIVGQIVLAGKLWQKCVNFGPEDGRAFDWTESGDL